MPLPRGDVDRGPCGGCPLGQLYVVGVPPGLPEVGVMSRCGEPPRTQIVACEMEAGRANTAPVRLISHLGRNSWCDGRTKTLATVATLTWFAASRPIIWSRISRRSGWLGLWWSWRLGWFRLTRNTCVTNTCLPGRTGRDALPIGLLQTDITGARPQDVELRTGGASQWPNPSPHMRDSVPLAVRTNDAIFIRLVQSNRVHATGACIYATATYQSTDWRNVLRPACLAGGTYRENNRVG